MNYIIPEIKASKFTCPYCNTLAQQKWYETQMYYGTDQYFFVLGSRNYEPDEIVNVSTCQSCKGYHIWISSNMIIPSSLGIPLPNEDMPQEIKDIYLEAREVYTASPRASAALLRLGLQHLCMHLGGEGKNINNDIAEFVKNGLDVRVQKALDIVRVTGNNAVHPGQLDFVDNNDTASKLFGLLNFIVDNLITQPSQIDSFFNDLPLGVRNAIERRDTSTVVNP